MGQLHTTPHYLWMVLPLVVALMILLQLEAARVPVDRLPRASRQAGAPMRKLRRPGAGQLAAVGAAPGRLHCTLGIGHAHMHGHRVLVLALEAGFIPQGREVLAPRARQCGL